MAHHKFLLFTALSNVCIVTIPPAIQDFRYDSHRFFLSLLPSIYPVSVRFSKPSFLIYPWNSDFSLFDSQYKQLRSHENWQSSQLDECLFSQICRVFLSVLWKNLADLMLGQRITWEWMRRKSLSKFAKNLLCVIYAKINAGAKLIWKVNCRTIATNLQLS